MRTTADDIAQIERMGYKQPREDITLRPFQLLAYYFGIRVKRFVLSLDKGLGKTLVDYLILEALGTPRLVVCCTTNAYTTWEQEALKWKTKYGNLVQIVEGTAASRSSQWRNPEAKIFVTTPQAFLGDCGGITRKGVPSDVIVPKWVFAPGWALILDEFQRFLRNAGTKKKPNKFFDLLKKLPFDIFIPTSGSAVSKGPQDIYAVLHLIDPKKFPSYYKYIATWCEVDDTGFGMTIIGPKLEAVENWRKYVGQWIFHRTKAMVADQLPPKNRLLHDVRMHDWQKALHDELRDDLYTECPDGSFLFAKNALAKIYQLRLALICPQALNESYGVGAGIESIVDECEASGIRRFVISTPFRKPIPYLKRYLESQGFNVWVLWGGISKEEREAAIAAWSAGEGVILQTIKYAQSYELTASPYGFMLGYEWDPEDNKQAEDRQNRLSSTEPTFIYYVRHLGAYDEELLQINMDKTVNVGLLWGTIGRRLLKEEASTVELLSVTQKVGSQDFSMAEIPEANFEDNDGPEH